MTEQNDAAAELVGNYDIVTAEVAKKSASTMQYHLFVRQRRMKDKLSSYLSVLFEQNPKPWAASSPADDFYYAG